MNEKISDFENKKFDLALIESLDESLKKKLKEIGVKTIKDLIIVGANEISTITRIKLDIAEELCNKARLILQDMDIIEKNFVSATSLYEKRKMTEKISTGSDNLNELLEGGIETGAITEIYGEFGTGKTQICHTLSIMTQLPKESGGLEGKVIYIDTENTFRPERIVSISKYRNIENYNKILDDITVAKAYTSSHQELIVQETGKIIQENNVKLLIIDSAIALFRAEFLGRGVLSERQQRINRLMHMLIRISETYKIAIVVTNQVQSSPDGFVNDFFKPIGGNVIAHSSTYRIFLRKSGKNRIARMVDSPYHPEREILFTLNDKGIGDPEK